MRKNYLLLFLFIPFFLSAQNKLVVSKRNLGRTYEGIGALSAGASTRLLPDYEEPYRSQILDYLFKPKYGASLNHLKVEIGGDVNSTCGTEPSHNRDGSQSNYTRGYEWWLMKEAKKRNAEIKLDVLQWGAPYWIGNGKFYSQDNIDYIIDFIKGAKKAHGLEIDYAGIWNETPFEVEYIKDLARSIRQSGLSTKVVAADEVCTWKIADLMHSDSDLMDAVDVIGTHYPQNGSSVNAMTTEKPIWASEEGATMRGWWDAACHLIKKFNRGYIDGKIVKHVVWSVVGAYYDILPVPESGLMNAREPWSGCYQLKPALWTIAHYTQFAEPGWKFCESASGYVDEKKSVSYVTLMNPENNDFSVILETVDAKDVNKVSLDLQAVKGVATLFLWKTDKDNSFYKVDTYKNIGGKLVLELEPGGIYTLTTTTGQKKGDSRIKIPATSSFPFPYAEDFESTETYKQPKYISDQSGVFEVVNEVTDKTNKVLKQSIAKRGIEWLYHVNPEPHTFVGDTCWKDYTVEMDAQLTDSCTNVVLFGRLNGMYQHTTTEPNSYWLRVYSDGKWELGKTLPSLLNGHLDFRKEWPDIAAGFNDTSKSLQLTYKDLLNLNELRKAQIGKVFEYLVKLERPEDCFLELLWFGMYDLRQRTILSSGKMKLPEGKWMNLKMQFQDNHIKAFLNGRLLTEKEDSSFVKGMTGLGCDYGACYFDNLKVY